mgnify:CR=1 FL=1
MCFLGSHSESNGGTATHRLFLNVVETREPLLLLGFRECLCLFGEGKRKSLLGGAGHLLATTGFSRQSDRQLFIWDARNTADPLSKTDVDQASGSLMPFYDPDAALLYLAGKGDCNIRYYEVLFPHPIAVAPLLKSDTGEIKKDPS